MSATPEFTPIHHVILNCAAGLCLEITADEGRTDLVLNILADALAVAPRDTAMRSRLCEVADLLMPPRHQRRGLEWAFARATASTALANLFYWRAGLADAAAKGDQNAA